MSNTADTVVKVVASMAPGSPATVQLTDELIADLAYTSLQLLELTIALEQAFAVGTIEPAVMVDIVTVGDIVMLVERLQTRSA